MDEENIVSTEVITKQNTSVTMPDEEMISILQSSIYPGASTESVKMVLGYCMAAGLDPFQKPVHIVPMWDGNARKMRDVVMPGIGLYRVQAARSKQYAGVSEPEFGPDVTGRVGSVEITYPAWCKVTVRRQLASGMIVDFTAVERWLENYAVKGGAEKSTSPNSVWSKRPYGQIAKCAEAQALRKGFPEVGAQPTAEEMEGKEFIDMVHESPKTPSLKHTPNDGAGDSLSSDKKNLIADTATAIKDAYEDNNAYRIAALYNPIQDNDERLFLWSLLDSKIRSTITAYRAIITAKSLDDLKAAWEATPKHAHTILLDPKDERKNQLTKLEVENGI